eukprot:scaffold5452_cov144-Chaetoceros_neogracile.AAC.1
MVTFFSTMPDPSDDTNYVSSFPGGATSALLVQQSYHVGKKDETNNGGGDCSHDWSCSFKCCNCFNIRTKSTSSLRPECLHRFCNTCSDNEDIIRLLKLDQCPACQKDLDETLSEVLSVARPQLDKSRCASSSRNDAIIDHVEPPYEHTNKRRGANAKYLEKAISRWGGKRKRTTQDDDFGNNVKRTRDENDAAGVPTKQEMFEDRFAELAAFTTKHGHCNPSITPSSEYDSLREWCNGVRYVYNENMQQRKTTIMGTLSHDQIRRLEELGFEWNKNTLFED